MGKNCIDLSPLVSSDIYPWVRKVSVFLLISHAIILHFYSTTKDVIWVTCDVSCDFRNLLYHAISFEMVHLRKVCGYT